MPGRCARRACKEREPQILKLGKFDNRFGRQKRACTWLLSLASTRAHGQWYCWCYKCTYYSLAVRCGSTVSNRKAAKEASEGLSEVRLQSVRFSELYTLSVLSALLTWEACGPPIFAGFETASDALRIQRTDQLVYSYPLSAGRFFLVARPLCGGRISPIYLRHIRAISSVCPLHSAGSAAQSHSLSAFHLH